MTEKEVLKQNVVGVLHNVYGEEAVEMVNDLQRERGHRNPCDLVHPMSEFDEVLCAKTPTEILNLAYTHGFIPKDTGYFNVDENGELTEFISKNVWLVDFDVDIACLEEIADIVLNRGKSYGIKELDDILLSRPMRWCDELGKVWMEYDPMYANIACMYVAPHKYVTVDDCEWGMVLRDDRNDDDCPMSDYSWDGANAIYEPEYEAEVGEAFRSLSLADQTVYHLLCDFLKQMKCTNRSEFTEEEHGLVMYVLNNADDASWQK